MSQTEGCSQLGTFLADNPHTCLTSPLLLHQVGYQVEVLLRLGILSVHVEDGLELVVLLDLLADLHHGLNALPVQSRLRDGQIARNIYTGEQLRNLVGDLLLLGH